MTVWFPLLLVLLASPRAATAQRLHTYVYGPQDGLVSGKIYDIEQDRSGRLWLATRHGLLSYDGHDWSHFENIRYNKVGGPRCLQIDEDNRLWSVTALAPLRVSCQTVEGEQLHYSRPDMPKPETTASAFLLVGIDGEGADLVLGTTGSEVARLVDGVWRTWNMDDRIEWVSAIFSTDSGPLACTSSGLWRIPREGEPEPVRFPGLPDGPVSTVAPAGDGGFWLTGHDWIGRLENGRVELLARDADIHLSQTSLGTSAQEGPNGELYFGDYGHLFQFDPATGEIETVGRAEGLVSSGTTDLLMDHEGTVWVASFRGLTKILDRAIVSYDSRHGLLEDEVSAVLERRDGTIVFGHAGGLTFMSQSTSTRRFAEDSPFMRVMDLEEGPDGALWIAADRAGLFRWSPDEGFERHYLAESRDKVVYGQVFAPDGVHWV